MITGREASFTVARKAPWMFRETACSLPIDHPGLSDDPAKRTVRSRSTRARMSNGTRSKSFSAISEEVRRNDLVSHPSVMRRNVGLAGGRIGNERPTCTQTDISLHVPSRIYTQTYTLYYLFLLPYSQCAALTWYAYWDLELPPNLLR